MPHGPFSWSTPEASNPNQACRLRITPWSLAWLGECRRVLGNSRMFNVCQHPPMLGIARTASRCSVLLCHRKVPTRLRRLRCPSARSSWPLRWPAWPQLARAILRQSLPGDVATLGGEWWSWHSGTMRPTVSVHLASCCRIGEPPPSSKAGRSLSPVTSFAPPGSRCATCSPRRKVETIR